MAHISLSPQVKTGLISLAVAVLTWFAENASQVVNPTYAAFVAFLAGAIAAFLTHNYYAPGPTANAGAPSTAAGPPAP